MISIVQRASITPKTVFWLYLALVTIAELVTSVWNAPLGLLLHLAILIGLILHSALTADTPIRKLALSLTLAPMTRLLSLSLPLLEFPQLAWYPLVSVPLLIALVIIVRQTHASRVDLRLTIGNLWLQLMLGGAGFALGVMEYVILQPEPLVSELTMRTMLLPALNLLIFTGFAEEVIFRGLLQTVAQPILRRDTLIYVSLLFAVLHIGYLSIVDVIFVFCVGLAFAYVAHWSKSIFGLTIAHGITNITLFLIAPYVHAHAGDSFPGWALIVTAAGGIGALSATWWLWRGWSLPARQTERQLWID